MRTRLVVAVILVVALLALPLRVFAQGADNDAALVQLTELVDTFIKLCTFAFLVLPATEVRKIFGGLPDITLPYKDDDGKPKYVIKAGRWVSWLIALGVVIYGHAAGILRPPESLEGLTPWLAAEWAVTGVLANTLADKWWKGVLGLTLIEPDGPTD